MKNTSIFGFGVTAKAILNFLNTQGQKCFVFDDAFEYDANARVDDFGNVFLSSKLFDPKKSKLEITSPGIPPTHSLIVQAKHLVGEYDYFYDLFSKDFCPRVIWISGTNGKTTTTEMLAMLLNGYGALSGGNNGVPLACLYAQKSLLWVLETSSFSTHYVQRACPDLYILLPVKQDHISWHGSFKAYVEAKLKPLRLMKKGSYAIIPEDFKNAAEVSNFQGEIFLYKDSASLKDFLGIKNGEIHFDEPFLLDGLLALTASKILFDKKNIDLLNTFKIGKHKVEEFYDKKGRLWVDDSKGTNVDATLEAIKHYRGKKIFLILGGDDKGAIQTPIFELIKELDVEIFPIGSNQNTLIQLAKDYGVKTYFCHGELQKAVLKIKNLLGQNDVALLSPAAASLDQFSSYKHRGEMFKKYVCSDVTIDKQQGIK